MKKLLCFALSVLLLAGCTAAPTQTTGPESAGEVLIRLSDEGIEFPADSGVTTDGDILCDSEAPEAHTVVRITKPGVYRLTGSLSAGQIAVDLGEDAKTDPEAGVVLILDGADITCRVAPAIIFYNVYESGVPNGLAGAHVLLAKDSENRVVGSHTEEYDGAFYSRMSMKLEGTGQLRIEADNEGLCSEMHLTIDGGEIYIDSGNDGINANEDNVSAITINGGKLWVACGGGTGEGDGIDSNGSIIINGGHVEAYACATSGDSGIDADMGIQINGGTVIAAGNMLDRIAGSQTHVVFTFADTQKNLVYALKDQYASTVLEAQTPNAFTGLIFSSPELTEGTYTLWSGDTQFRGAAGQGGGFFGNMQPIERPDWPGRDDGADVEIPPQPSQPVYTQGQQPPPGEQPADMPVPPMPGGSEDMPVPPMPEGTENMPTPPQPPQSGGDSIVVIPSTLSAEFPIRQGANYFYALQPME